MGRITGSGISQEPNMTYDTEEKNLVYLTDKEDILRNILQLNDFHTDNTNTKMSVSILVLITFQ